MNSTAQNTKRSTSSSRSPLKQTIQGSMTLSGKPLQKQTLPSSDLLRSFKATTHLANALTKERIHIQNDL